MIEIADASLASDRKLAATYAREGIAFYWLVNIPDRCVEVHEAPGEAGFGSLNVYPEYAEVPLVLDGHEGAGSR